MTKLEVLTTWLALVGLAVGGAILVVLMMLFAALPYAAILAIVLVCFRYLGWF
jgi:hypothetical protein